MIFVIEKDVTSSFTDIGEVEIIFISFGLDLGWFGAFIIDKLIQEVGRVVEAQLIERHLLVGICLRLLRILMLTIKSHGQCHLRFLIKTGLFALAELIHLVEAVVNDLITWFGSFPILIWISNEV